MKVKNFQKGFTIVELLIATSVFSIMILLVTTGIIQVSRVYYKGITSSRTQETTRSVVDDISRSFQLGSNSTLSSPSTATLNGLEVTSQCIGNVRYSYTINSKLDLANNVSPRTSLHVLWVDIITSGLPCSPLDLTQPVPQDGSTDLVASASQRKELLARNMRLLDFSMSPAPSSDSLINIRLRIIHGDDDIIDNRGTAETVDDTCRSNQVGGQFCAAAGLETFVKKRL